MRKTVSSGYAFEESYGYSRAVRVGAHVYVSGTTARGADLDGDAYDQSKAILRVIENALTEAGAGLRHVVRSVVYAVDIADEPLIARAHRETFHQTRPASTLVQVSALSPKEARVEFEVTAVIDG